MVQDELSTAERRLSRRLVCQSIALLAAGGTSALRAQGAWPQKPIRLVVPFAPGGSSEVVARSVAGELTKLLEQRFFVENQPGAAGTIAMQDVAKAGADGYTPILGHVGTLAVNPCMLSNQTYDVNKDFVPVTLLAKVPNVLVVHPDVPVKTQGAAHRPGDRVLRARLRPGRGRHARTVRRVHRFTAELEGDRRQGGHQAGLSRRRTET